MYAFYDEALSFHKESIAIVLTDCATVKNQTGTFNGLKPWQLQSPCLACIIPSKTKTCSSVRCSDESCQNWFWVVLEWINWEAAKERLMIDSIFLNQPRPSKDMDRSVLYKQETLTPRLHFYFGWISAMVQKPGLQKLLSTNGVSRIKINRENSPIKLLSPPVFRMIGS